MKTDNMLYNDADLQCEGFVAYDDSTSEKRPCILILHAWAGLGDFEREKAKTLAKMGYVAVALDLYGKDVRGIPTGDNSALMQPFLDDRAMLLRRMQAGLEVAKQLSVVDTQQIGAIGFCFGGLCVLDLARAVLPEVKGVVSFHGLLHPPGLGEQKTITAKILIQHGYDDPLGPPPNMLAIADELTKAKADWQIHVYGDTAHAFMAPAMQNKAGGFQYNETVAKRAWKTMTSHFEECFS